METHFYIFSSATSVIDAFKSFAMFIIAKPVDIQFFLCVPRCKNESDSQLDERCVSDKLAIEASQDARTGQAVYWYFIPKTILLPTSHFPRKKTIVSAWSTLAAVCS
jgi:hypothetical protein